MLSTRIKQASYQGDNFASQYIISTEILVDMVYSYARQKDEKSLLELVNQGYCLGVFHGLTNAIMLLAKDGDVDSVDFLIYKFKANRNHAVQGYAMGEHTRLVDCQIECGASRRYATLGYAMIGRVDLVDHHIALGAKKDLALQGFGAAGNTQQVNKLLLEGVNRCHAVIGYAMGGYFEEIDKLNESNPTSENLSGDLLTGAIFGNHYDYIDQHNLINNDNFKYTLVVYGEKGDVGMIASKCDRANRHCIPALYGFACGGHIDQVNEFYCCEKDDNNLDRVSSAYESFDHLSQNNILRLMTYTADIQLRRALADCAKVRSPSLNVDYLMDKSSLINRIMQAYSLDYRQALSLTVQGARCWLLEGLQLGCASDEEQSNTNGSDVLPSENRYLSSLPIEMYLYICSYVLGLPLRDTIMVREAVHKNLFVKMTELNLSKFKSGLFSMQTFSQSFHESEDRYQARWEGYVVRPK